MCSQNIKREIAKDISDIFKITTNQSGKKRGRSSSDENNSIISDK